MDDQKLRIRIEDGDPPVIHAYGELDYTNCEDLMKVLHKALPACNKSISLSLGGLDFVDSSGVRVLVITAQDARESGCTLDIASLTPQLHRMLHLSKFAGLFGSIAEPFEAACTSCVEQPREITHSFKLCADRSLCGDGRDKVCAFAESVGFRSTAIDDIRLATGEALSNAVRHGKCNGDNICVDCRCDDGRLQITLAYPSDYFDPDKIPVPDMATNPTGGMGIHFMKLVMDKVEYQFRDGLAFLTLEKHLDTEPCTPGSEL